MKSVKNADDLHGKHKCYLIKKYMVSTWKMYLQKFILPFGIDKGQNVTQWKKRERKINTKKETELMSILWKGETW